MSETGPKAEAPHHETDLCGDTPALTGRTTNQPKARSTVLITVNRDPATTESVIELSVDQCGALLPTHRWTSVEIDSLAAVRDCDDLLDALLLGQTCRSLVLAGTRFRLDDSLDRACIKLLRMLLRRNGKSSSSQSTDPPPTTNRLRDKPPVAVGELANPVDPPG